MPEIITIEREYPNIKQGGYIASIDHDGRTFTGKVDRTRLGAVKSLDRIVRKYDEVHGL